MESGEKSKRGDVKRKGNSGTNLPGCFLSVGADKCRSAVISCASALQQGTVDRSEDTGRPRPLLQQLGGAEGKNFNESTSWPPSSLPANTDKNTLLLLVLPDVSGGTGNFLCLTYCRCFETKMDEDCSESGAASAGGPEGCFSLASSPLAPSLEAF